MKIAADFDQRVVVHSETLEWLASPMAGVDRRPLDRVGDEVARATTIVRYAPGSHFSPHVHTGGEEFLVLDGVFQDEHGDFPAGSYIRNPPTSSHTPGSDLGCVIFVKLHQFQPQDRTHVRLQINNMGNVKDKNIDGLAITPLYKDEFEQVQVLHLNAQTQATFNTPNGAELLVIKGTVTEQNERLVKHSWLRSPMDSTINLKAGDDGAIVWMKTGHLQDINNQIARVKAL